MSLDSSTQGTPPPGASRQAGADPGASPAGPSGRGRLLLVVGLVVVVAGLGAAGYLLLGGVGTDSDVGTAAARRGSATTPSASSTASPTSPEATTAARNPFAGSAQDPGAASASGSAPAPTVTVTVTPSATAAGKTYLGLYGYASSGKADFWVNAREYLVSVGSDFASSYTFVSQTSSNCAKVLHDGRTRTICPGEVQAVD